jgi:hypothetical protein
MYSQLAAINYELYYSKKLEMLILDEVHKIHNCKTTFYDSAIQLFAFTRLLLTSICILCESIPFSPSSLFSCSSLFLLFFLFSLYLISYVATPLQNRLNDFRSLVNCAGCLKKKYLDPARFDFINIKLSNLKAAKNKDIKSVFSFTLRRKLLQVQPDLLLCMSSFFLYTIMQFTNQKLV